MDASLVYVRALALGLLLQSEGADRVGGQLRGDKECPFSGVIKSGRVWRKVPESGARSVIAELSLQITGTSLERSPHAHPSRTQPRIGEAHVFMKSESFQ